MSAVGIVGAGRAGLALARALEAAGRTVHVFGRGEPVVLPPPVVVVLLAVPDGMITAAARALPADGRHTVLHLAGPLGVEALAPLRDRAAALGAMHPLLGLRGRATPPERFRGAVAALDGDDAALAAGRDLAAALGMVPVVVRGPARARYHAAAVFAANYLVALAASAERLMTEAGLPDDVARRGIVRLMESSLDNVAQAGPAAALTGPIARGDADTVARHLAALGEGPDADLYRSLGRATLRLARLDPAVRARIEALLQG